MAELGFRILATRGTAGVLGRSGVPAMIVLKRSEGSPNAADLIDSSTGNLFTSLDFEVQNPEPTASNGTSNVESISLSGSAPAIASLTPALFRSAGLF